MINNSLKIFIIKLFLIFFGCDSNNNEIVIDNITTSDINDTPLLLDLQNQVYLESWDMKFSNSPGYYNIELNTSGGVMSINQGIQDFDNAVLPDSGFSYDSLAIGGEWVDIETYNCSIS